MNRFNRVGFRIARGVPRGSGEAYIYGLAGGGLA